MRCARRGLCLAAMSSGPVVLRIEVISSQAAIDGWSDVSLRKQKLQVTSKVRRVLPIVVAPVRIAHRRSSKLLGVDIIQGGDEHTNEVAAHVVCAAKLVGPYPAGSAEIFERRLGMLAIADRVVAAAQEAE